MKHLTISNFAAVRGPAEPLRRPRPSTAYQIGQGDVLAGLWKDAHSFKFPELQSEYERGFDREARDLRDAKHG